MGVEEVFVTLNVGLGTFRPVSEERIEDHEMHSEFYSVTPAAAAAVNRAKAEGRRVVAVGTTSIRTLESAGKDGVVQAGSGWTDIFIYELCLQAKNWLARLTLPVFLQKTGRALLRVLP